MNVYQHFRPEEHLFIDHVLSWKKDVENTYQYKLTDFLDPREQQIVNMLIGTTNDDLQLSFYGGGKYTERKRAIIAPFYEEISNLSFQLSLLQATFNDKFVSITHPDVMGAFLSLGIERKKLGDILVESNMIQIILAKEIGDYVGTNLTKIKNATIKLTEHPVSSILEKELNWVESDKTVSSFRLDNVIKEIYNVSRKDAANFILKKQVKVNFRVIEDIKFQLFAGDLISVRGKGRSKLISINGQTRKDKFRITTALLK